MMLPFYYAPCMCVRACAVDDIISRALARCITLLPPLSAMPLDALLSPPLRRYAALLLLFSAAAIAADFRAPCRLMPPLPC